MRRSPYCRYKGWLNLDEVSADFERYAKVVFNALGDRVKYWLTFNEPVVITTLGHSLGVFAPGRCSDRKRSPEGDSSTEVNLARADIRSARPQYIECAELLVRIRSHGSSATPS